SGLAGTAEELPADALNAGEAGAPEPGPGQGRRLTAGAKETTMTMLDDTHDPAARSWVASAQAEGCDFPLQNLPFAVFRRAGTNEAFRGGIAIGDRILDIGRAHAGGHFSADAAVAAAHAARSELNGLMALGPRYWRALRRAMF